MEDAPTTALIPTVPTIAHAGEVISYSRITEHAKVCSNKYRTFTFAVSLPEVREGSIITILYFFAIICNPLL